MTYVIKSEKIDNYTIEISQDKYSTCYNVALIQMFDNSRGIEINKNVYPTLEKAKRRFSQLKRQI